MATSKPKAAGNKAPASKSRIKKTDYQFF